jgi:hypothetical protein
MIRLKYIMFEAGVGEGSEVKQRIPILFFEPLTHVGMYYTMAHSRHDELPRDAELVSAGFVTVRGVEIECFGESESLKDAKLPHVPLPEDAKTISTHNYFHGIVP